MAYLPLKTGKTICTQGKKIEKGKINKKYMDIFQNI